MNLRELAEKPEKFASGHRSCPGCGFPVIVRSVLAATDKPVVVVCATGCLEVTTTIYPFTSWKVPFMHSAFENAPATMSGVIAAYKSLNRKDDVKFVVFGGDGGSYDIGLQSLSGAFERGDEFLYVCYDNGAYMNTGVQRSSATPKGAYTTTTPAGKVEWRKDLTKIAIAHGIPYAATASPHNLVDLTRKAEKAFNTKGPTFLNVLSTCPLGWGSKYELGIEVARLAVKSNVWPLYEYENGKYIVSDNPNYVPAEEFFKLQSRFKRLLKPENKDLLDAIQKQIDEKWIELKKLAGSYEK